MPWLLAPIVAHHRCPPPSRGSYPGVPSGTGRGGLTLVGMSWTVAFLEAFVGPPAQLVMTQLYGVLGIVSLNPTKPEQSASRQLCFPFVPFRGVDSGGSGLNCGLLSFSMAFANFYSQGNL